MVFIEEPHSLTMTQTLINPLIRLCAIIFLQFFCTNAIAQTWQWGKKGGASGDQSAVYSQDRIWDMCTDVHGNVYAVAVINKDNANLTGTTITGYAGSDILLFSYDCNGNFRWKKVIGGPQSDAPFGMRIDTLGNIYVCGRVVPKQTSLEIHVKFDSDSTLVYGDMRSAFLAQYDTLGNLNWLRMPQADTVSFTSSLTNYRIWHMDVTPDGKVYMVAKFLAGKLSAPGNPVLPASSNYILEYDKNGNYIGASPIQLEMYDAAFLARIKYNRHNGLLYYYGQSYPYNPGGFIKMGSTTLSKMVFLAKYNTNGNLVSLVESDGGSFEGIEFDEEGNMYIAGVGLAGKQHLGQTFATGSSSAPYAAKLDTNDKIIWIKKAVTNGASSGRDVALRGNELIFAGDAPGKMVWKGEDSIENIMNQGYDVFITRFDRHNGKVIEIDTLESMFGVTEFSNFVVTDKKGNAYLGGDVRDQIYIAGNSYDATVNGYKDFFIAKLGTSDCNCLLPILNCNSTALASNRFAFSSSFTSTVAVDSAIWDFGDGTSSTQSTPIHIYSTPGNYMACFTVYTKCGNEAKCFNLQATLSVADLEGKDVKLYPIPAEYTLTIDGIGQGTSYEVYSQVGARVLSGALNGKQVDISMLPAGIYIMNLEGKDHSITRLRFLKQ